MLWTRNGRGGALSFQIVFRVNGLGTAFALGHWSNVRGVAKTARSEAGIAHSTEEFDFVYDIEEDNEANEGKHA